MGDNVVRLRSGNGSSDDVEVLDPTAATAPAAAASPAQAAAGGGDGGGAGSAAATSASATLAEASAASRKRARAAAAAASLAPPTSDVPGWTRWKYQGSIRDLFYPMPGRADRVICRVCGASGRNGEGLNASHGTTNLETHLNGDEHAAVSRRGAWPDGPAHSLTLPLSSSPDARSGSRGLQTSPRPAARASPTPYSPSWASGTTCRRFRCRGCSTSSSRTAWC